MRTIKEKIEFDQIISQQGEHLFFVHSSWAIQSHQGKKKLENIKEKFGDLNLTIIFNDMNCDSFIYEWLANEENNYLIQEKRPTPGPWIHGMGELFLVKDNLLRKFNITTIQMEERELIALLQLEND